MADKSLTVAPGRSAAVREAVLADPSPVLAQYVEASLNGALPVSVPAAIVTEARVQRDRLVEALKVPGSQLVALRWMRDFADSAPRLGTPALDDDIAKACRGIWETCEGLPACVWTRETRIEFQRKQRFWPMPSDVFAFLNAKRATLAVRLIGCDRIVAHHVERQVAAKRAAEGQGRSPAAIQAVAALARSTRLPALPSQPSPYARPTSRPPPAPPSVAAQIAQLAESMRSAASPELREVARQRHARLVQSAAAEAQPSSTNFGKKVVPDETPFSPMVLAHLIRVKRTRSHRAGFRA